MSDAPPKQLALNWKTGSDFLSCFEDGPKRTIRRPCGRADLPELGGLCSLLLRLEDRSTEFQMHGVLTDYREGVATFELLPEEQMRHELVLVGARGESLPYRRRRHTRVPCHFVASVLGTKGERIVANTTTFGAGGVHLALDEPIATEERIQVTITLADGRNLEIAGRVTSCIEEGPERGSSVEFLFRSAAQRDEVAAIVADLEASSQRDR